MTLGVHGWEHHDKSCLPLQDALRALKQGQGFLQEITGQQIKDLAWPHGGYTRDLVKEAAALGLTRQLALDYLYEEDGADPTIRDRFGINPFISLGNQVECLLRGHYQ
jgi:peptidoglycan/xylan/chitin deacetylase (PgdA/CDA1 family)